MGMNQHLFVDDSTLVANSVRKLNMLVSVRRKIRVMKYSLSEGQESLKVRMIRGIGRREYSST